MSRTEFDERVRVMLETAKFQRRIRSSPCAPEAEFYAELNEYDPHLAELVRAVHDAEIQPVNKLINYIESMPMPDTEKN